MGTGSGVARYDKIKYRTRTHATHFGNTAGIPVPVLNAKYGSLDRIICIYGSNLCTIAKIQ